MQPFQFTNVTSSTTGKPVTFVSQRVTNFPVNIPEFASFEAQLSAGQPIDLVAYEAVLRRTNPQLSHAHIQQELTLLKYYNQQFK